MSAPQGQAPIDDERRALFLETLARTGSLAHAAAVASPHLAGRSPHPGQSSFRKLMRTDPAFTEAVEEARKAFLGKVEEAIASRALEGWEEPVYQGGALVGTKRVYDNRMLLAAARRHDPEAWSERSKLEVSGQVAHAHLGVHVTLEDLDLLSEEDRSALLECFAKIVERRTANGPQRIPVAGRIDPPGLPA